MPFSNFNQLPSLNLQLQRANYQPLPARIPKQNGLLIAQALAQFLPEAMKGLDPRERLRQKNQELEYKMNLQKYSYLQQHPDLLGGKSQLEIDAIKARTEHEQEQTNKLRRENQPQPSWNSLLKPKATPFSPVTMIDLGQSDFTV